MDYFELKDKLEKEIKELENKLFQTQTLNQSSLESMRFYSSKNFIIDLIDLINYKKRKLFELKTEIWFMNRGRNSFFIPEYDCQWVFKPKNINKRLE